MFSFFFFHPLNSSRLVSFNRASGIQPIFVFSGLSILRKDKPFSTEDSRPGHRAAGWDFYDRGKLDLALSNWASSSGIYSAELLNTVISILNKHNIEFIRAPYSSWAQVSLNRF